MGRRPSGDLGSDFRSARLAIACGLISYWTHEPLLMQAKHRMTQGTSGSAPGGTEKLKSTK